MVQINMVPGQNCGKCGSILLWVDEEAMTWRCPNCGQMGCNRTPNEELKKLEERKKLVNERSEKEIQRRLWQKEFVESIPDGRYHKLLEMLKEYEEKEDGKTGYLECSEKVDRIVEKPHFVGTQYSKSRLPYPYLFLRDRF